MNTSPSASGLSPQTRRRAALLAALTLFVSMLAAPATAEIEPTATSTTTTTKDPVETAKATAKAQNKRIEIESLRSETSTFYANPDGKTLRAEVSSTPIRLRKDGAWQAIDARLIEDNGALKPKAVKGKLSLSTGGTAKAVTFTDSTGERTLSAPAKLPKPEVKGNTATYPDAYGPGSDLVVTVTPQGFRQDVVIRQRPTTDLTFRVPIDLPKGLKLGKGTGKSPAVLDSKGKQVDTLGSALITDAAALTDPDQGHLSRAKTALDGDTIVLTAPADFLTDPAVTYPVTVTATTEIWEGTGIAGDTHVSTVRPNGDENALLDWLLAGRSHGGDRTHRSYIDFHISGTPLEGGTVHNADLRLHNQDSDQCDDEASPGIVARRVTADWNVNTITWSDQPPVTSTGQVGNRGAYSATRCPEGEGELYHSIEQITQDWMDGEPDYGLQLASASESVPTNWRYYRSNEYGGYDTYPFTSRGPVLFIEYTPGIQNYLDIPTNPDGSSNLAPYPEALASVQSDQFSGNEPVVPAVSSAEAEEMARQSNVSFSTTSTDIEQPTWATPEEIAQANSPDSLLPGTPLPTPTPSADSTAPSIIEQRPEANAVDVGNKSEIAVTFDEVVHNGTIILKDGQGNAVQGQLDIPSLTDDPFAIFSPDQPLTLSTTYTVEVSGFADASGNVTAPHSWTFTTGAAEEPDPTFPIPTPSPTSPGPTPGLVGAWGMNEGSGTSVADLSGQNNTGTTSGANWANGKYGQALSFDGAAGWVTVEDAESLRLTTGMTLSAWVNPASVSVWSPIVGKELELDGVSYTLYASNGSSGPAGWVQTDSVTSSTVNAVSPLPVNTWSHVALTYDGAAQRLFVDGQQIAETALSGSLYDDGNPLRIGGNQAWGEFFSGLIDEVRVYNRAQSATEIQTDMNTPVGSTTPEPEPTPTPTPTPDPTPNPVPGLVAAYGMEEGTGTSVGDSSGQNNTGAATDTTWTTGKHGTGLSFNGSSSWVTVPHAESLRLTNAMTLSAWVRPATADTWHTVLMKENDEGGSYGLYSSSDASLPAGWLHIASGPVTVAGDPLPLNQWSHLAFTYDGSMATLFIDGTQVGQASISGDIIDDGGVLRIGGNGFWGEFFSGQIDEVRVYNRVQTATEIQSDMNTAIGAVATAAAAQMLQQSSAPRIQKLVVGDSGSVDGIAVTSDPTPNLAAWLPAGRDGEAKVEVEIAREPIESAKIDKTSVGKQLIWSDQATAKHGDSRVVLQVPKGRLKNGSKVRWRARVITTDDAPGDWSAWQNLHITQNVANPAKENAVAKTASTLASDLDDCRATPREKIGSRGWAKNRYTYCYWETREFVRYNNQNLRDGEIEYKVTVLGKLNPHTRTFKYEAYISDIEEDDHPLGWNVNLKVGFSVTRDGSSSDGQADCRPDPGNLHRQATFRQWQGYGDNVAVQATFTSPHSTSKYLTDEQRDFCQVRVWGYYPDPSVVGPRGVSFQMRSNVRCDSALYLAGHGCVYYWSIPHLKLKYDQQYWQQITHIWMALKYPQSTFPTHIKKIRLDKDIPGGELHKRITRHANKNLKDNNRSRSRRICRLLWGLNYGARFARAHPNPDGTPGNAGECDEFPFAATLEGSTHRDANKKFTNNWSVLVIDEDQNGQWGSRVWGTWLLNERIMDKDTLWINMNEINFPENSD